MTTFEKINECFGMLKAKYPKTSREDMYKAMVRVMSENDPSNLFKLKILKKFLLKTSPSAYEKIIESYLKHHTLFDEEGRRFVRMVSQKYSNEKDRMRYLDTISRMTYTDLTNHIRATFFVKYLNVRDKEFEQEEMPFNDAKYYVHGNVPPPQGRYDPEEEVSESITKLYTFESDDDKYAFVEHVSGFGNLDYDVEVETQKEFKKIVLGRKKKNASYSVFKVDADDHPVDFNTDDVVYRFLTNT